MHFEVVVDSAFGHARYVLAQKRLVVVAKPVVVREGMNETEMSARVGLVGGRRLQLLWASRRNQGEASRKMTLDLRCSTSASKLTIKPCRIRVMYSAMKHFAKCTSL